MSLLVDGSSANPASELSGAIPGCEESCSQPKAKQPKGRIMGKFVSVCSTLKDISSVIKTVNSIVKLLKVLNLVAAPIVEVLPFVGLVTYSIGVLPSSILEAVKGIQRVWSFSSLSKRLRACSTLGEKAAILQSKIDDIEAQSKLLRKDFLLSKEAAATLKERIDRIRRLQLPSSGEWTQEQEQDVVNMEAAVDVLKGRAGVILAYDSLELVSNIVQLASDVLFLTPFAPVAACLGLGSLVSSSIVSPLAKAYGINSNPFDPHSKSKALKLVDTVRSKARGVCRKLDIRRLRSHSKSTVAMAS